MKSTIVLLLVSLWTALVRAQTQTLVDAAGETVVVVVTTNRLQGIATTETLQTLDAEQTTTTTTQNQGPIVGQPAATTTGETTYQYTTTDAAGNTQVLTGIFTASTALVTGNPISSFTGAVVDYSSWLDMVGTNTVAATDVAVGSNARRSLLLPSRKNLAAGGAVALICGVLGGAWLAV